MVEDMMSKNRHHIVMVVLILCSFALLGGVIDVSITHKDSEMRFKLEKSQVISDDENVITRPSSAH